MIVCHKYKFIFLKTRKTAGTSIEVALSRLCTDGDIVTPIKGESIRRAAGGFGPSGCWLKWSDYSLGDYWQIARTRRRVPFVRDHCPALVAKELVGDNVWASYFKFAVERNPWDKAISMYFYQRSKLFGSLRNTSLERFLSDQKNWPLLSDWHIYSIGNQVAVDFVGHYENLNDDLTGVASEIGLPVSIELPRTKLLGNERRDRRSYRDVLGMREREIVQSICAREIEKFGYEW